MATEQQLANREKWRTALLSGDYAQGQKDLRQGDEDNGYQYCCLGVALDVIADGVWADTHTFITSDNVANAGALEDLVFEAMFGFAGDEVPSIAGFTVQSRDVQGRFIDANDIQGYTFEQIAEMIPTGS